MAWGEEGAAGVAWVADELGHLAEISGMKATEKVPRAGQSPRKDKVLVEQGVVGERGQLRIFTPL